MYPNQRAEEPDTARDGVSDCVDADVNCDGGINGIDALAILRFNVGLSVTQTQPCPALGVPYP